MVAHEGLIAIGADISNGFAEAPPPKALSTFILMKCIENGGLITLAYPPSPRNVTWFERTMQFKDIERSLDYGENILTTYFNKKV
jgi:hypothetical protein